MQIVHAVTTLCRDDECGSDGLLGGSPRSAVSAVGSGALEAAPPTPPAGI